MSKSIEKHTSISDYLDKLSVKFRIDLKASRKFLSPVPDDFYIHRINRKVGSEDIGIKPHRVDFFRLIYIEKGNLKINIDGRSIHYNDNFILLINPYQVISFSVSHVLGYAVYFLPTFINQSTYQRIEVEVPILRLHSSAFLGIGRKEKGFKFYLQSILREAYRQEVYYKKFIETSLWALLTLVNRLNVSKEVTTIENSRKINLLIEFESLILKYLPERKPLKYFAKKLSISKKHLNESVKRVTGKTTSQYINNLYMMEAERLLLHTDQSVLEISFFLGFKDASHFGKMFRSHFNISPLSYRKQRFKILEHQV